jgi:hypothetical protein
MSSALVGETDARTVTDVLDSVEIVVDPGDKPVAAQVGAIAAVASMASRVFGTVTIARDGVLPPNPWNVETLFELGPALRLLSDGSPRTRYVVAFGEDRKADWYAGGDDWTCRVSRTTSQPVGDCRFGGLGLHAAASLVFGEVLKAVLRPLGMRCVVIENTFVWNLLDGRLAPSFGPTHCKRLQPVDLAILGAGSVGSSAAGLIVMTPVRGQADVVDPDMFDPYRNTYRYPATPAAVYGPKAVWAAELLEAAGWSASPFVGSIDRWGSCRPEPGFNGLALVSVDRLEGRRDAADLLAHTTLSAGVAGLALHVQRSGANDVFACPYCEFVDVAAPRSQAEVYANMTGLDTSRVEELLSGKALKRHDVEGAVGAGAIADDHAEHLIGGRIEDLVRRHYARANVPLVHGGVDAGVSAPHVSWLAGTLLACEVVKAAIGLRPLDRRVEVDLSGLPLGGWRRLARDPTGRCTCTSSARRAAARRLYADGRG